MFALTLGLPSGEWGLGEGHCLKHSTWLKALGCWPVVLLGGREGRGPVDSGPHGRKGGQDTKKLSEPQLGLGTYLGTPGWRLLKIQSSLRLGQT